MALLVANFTTSGRTIGDGNRHSNVPQPDELGQLISPDEFIRKVREELNPALTEEAERLKSHCTLREMELECKPNILRAQLTMAEKNLKKATTRLEKLQAQQKYSAILKQLKQSKQTLFMDKVRLDMAQEEKIKNVLDLAKYSVDI